MKVQNKSSLIILAVVIIVVIGVIGFGLYQNSNKNSNSATSEEATTEVVTTTERTTEEVTTEEPTTEEPTTVEPTTEKPTEPPATESPETEPPVEEDFSQIIYNRYKNEINSNSTQMYYIYDINHDGIKELILELGNTTLNTYYNVYTFSKESGTDYYVDTFKGSMALYNSNEGTLKGFWARQGAYAFYDITMENGQVNTTLIYQDSTTGDYPELDGTRLIGAASNDLNLLVAEILN